MAIKAGFFGDDLNLEQRYIPDHAKLSELIDNLKKSGLKVVLTMGSYDMKHIGHDRYLMLGKALGHVLVVGVESDEKIRQRKGPRRPLYPEAERIEQLAHLRHVDIITLKNVGDPKWHLIKLVKPNVLQAVEGTYTEAELEQLREYCGEVVVQERQAETSTSAKLRKLMFDITDEVMSELMKVMPEAIQRAVDNVRSNV